jgi:hypothetical protein
LKLFLDESHIVEVTLEEKDFSRTIISLDHMSINQFPRMSMKEKQPFTQFLAELFL